MSKKPTPFNRIIYLLQELHKANPKQNIGRHLSMALSDYGDLWGVPDKEIAFALEKYQAQSELDPLASDAEVERIVREGMLLNADTFFEDDQEEEDEY